MIKAHDGRLKASQTPCEWQERFYRVLSSLSKHQYQHIIASSLKSAETIRILLLVCSYSGQPRGGSNIIHVELE